MKGIEVFRHRRRLGKDLVGTALLAALPVLGAAAEEEREFEKEMVEGRWMYTVLDFDAIPALDDPVFVSREEAEGFMEEGEPVLGLVLGGEARAYSLWQLEAHEVVNDRVGGRPVAVTW